MRNDRKEGQKIVGGGYGESRELSRAAGWRFGAGRPLPSRRQPSYNVEDGRLFAVMRNRCVWDGSVSGLNLEATVPVFADKQQFLACLDGRSTQDLEVFAEAKRHLPAAVAELGFEDFSGQDYEVMNRFQEQLVGTQSEAGLWGLVVVDLWFCKNFGGVHWAGLLARDAGNVRFAIQTAYWVFIMSGKHCGAALANLITRTRTWKAAQSAMRGERDKGLCEWWSGAVLPLR